MFGILFPNAALAFMPEYSHSRTILLIPSVSHLSPVHEPTYCRPLDIPFMGRR
jgi:hypothetical protein